MYTLHDVCDSPTSPAAGIFSAEAASCFVIKRKRSCRLGERSDWNLIERKEKISDPPQVSGGFVYDHCHQTSFTEIHRTDATMQNVHVVLKTRVVEESTVDAWNQIKVKKPSKRFIHLWNMVVGVSQLDSIQLIQDSFTARRWSRLSFSQLNIGQFFCGQVAQSKTDEDETLQTGIRLEWLQYEPERTWAEMMSMNHRVQAAFETRAPSLRMYLNHTWPHVITCYMLQIPNYWGQC